MTLGLANQIADACQDWAEDRNLNVTIAILDEGAHLLHFRRMDGTAVGAGELSIRKAKTSAIFPYPTHEWQPLIYGEEGEEPILRGVEHMPTIAIFGGGVPIITADGHHIGAIGVGGASPKEETECGNAAIEAASDILRAH
ncbi:GlcG/HbpS family heme-binding protein [Roseibium sp. SCP14]|uniref:GlcG/HbpS family heme-binding protein n=1 Tax=Roseibium sp. SCP14 TaxID=3141375 RepID=UPI00333AC94F